MDSGFHRLIITYFISTVAILLAFQAVLVAIIFKL